MIWNGYIYHYLLDFSDVNKILKSGKLYPIDELKDAKIIKFYSDLSISNKLEGSSEEKDDLENAEIHWKHFYDKFYKNVLKEPYKHYGIYMTTVDLFSFDNNINYRFKFIYEDLKNFKSVIQVSGKVKKINNSKDIELTANVYSNTNLVKRIWESTKRFKFKRLPQIVVFCDSIKIDKTMLEERN